MIGRISPGERAERGRVYKGPLEEPAVEAERDAQEVEGMSRREDSRQHWSPSQSPSRILGTWPAAWGNCVAQPKLYPSQGLWTVPSGCSRTAPALK